MKLDDGLVKKFVDRSVLVTMDRRDILDKYYPFAAYYVRKRPPTSTSHANTNTAVDDDDSESEYLMKFESFINNVTKTSQDVSRYILSRYNSSTGSSNSFMADSTQNVGCTHVDQIGGEACANLAVNCEEYYDDDEDEEEEGWRAYFSFGTYPSSCMWFLLQLSWRAMLTLSLALSVWYLATNPPPPRVSVKAAGVRRFALGQGEDASGVATKFMTCNCSMELIIDNKSKIFGLHVSPPLLQMSFRDNLHLAVSQGPKLFARRVHRTPLGVHVGVANKPIYGAGPIMESMLRSRRGLRIAVTVRFESNYRVVGSLIRPTFHHQTHCTLVVRKRRNRIEPYSSSSRCKMSLS